jgi:hypothetical protein
MSEPSDIIARPGRARPEEAMSEPSDIIARPGLDPRDRRNEPTRPNVLILQDM